MMKLYTVILGTIIGLYYPHVSRAQTDVELAPLLQLAKTGQVETLRSEMPALAKRYPDNPGVLYLQGIIETNGDKAISFFQSVVNSYPKSEWADDALYRLFQYNYAVGAYNIADTYLMKLATDYPSSSYLSRTKSETVKTPTQTVTNEATNDGFSVQIAALSSDNDADDLVEEMKKFGYSAETRSKTIGGKNVFAVWVGRFPDREAAASFAKKMKSRHHIEGFIVRR